jgi:hypothetical protein
MAKRRRPGSKARRIVRVIRILSALVLAVFVSQSTLAFAFPCLGAGRSADCCPDDEGEDDEEHQQPHDQKRCPCPLNCAPGCAGSAFRAVPSAPLDLVLVLPSPLAREILWLRAERAPPPIEPADIAHVPRSGA